jgi:predicted AAA+ superfamily ATPase
VLESSFVISCIYRLDKNKGVPYFEREKKIHFQDSFIFHALRGWSFSLPYYESSLEFLGNMEDHAKLVESVICNHLIRLAFNLSPSSDYEYVNKVTYWEGKHIREVDFAVRLNDKFLPIEVKCQSDFNRKDLFGLYGFMKGGSSYQGIVITKDLLKTERSITFIPNYLFLTLI